MRLFGAFHWIYISRGGEVSTRDFTAWFSLHKKKVKQEHYTGGVRRWSVNVDASGSLWVKGVDIVLLHSTHVECLLVEECPRASEDQKVQTQQCMSQHMRHWTQKTAAPAELEIVALCVTASATQTGSAFHVMHREMWDNNRSSSLFPSFLWNNAKPLTVPKPEPQRTELEGKEECRGRCLWKMKR